METAALSPTERKASDGGARSGGAEVRSGVKYRIVRHLAQELLQGRRFFKAKEIGAHVGATSRQVANYLRMLRDSSVFSISEQAHSSHSTTWRIEFRDAPWRVGLLLRGLPGPARRAL